MSNNSQIDEETDIPNVQDEINDTQSIEDAESKDHSLICPICLDQFMNESRLLPCYHGFCFDCIMEWSSISHFCPLCKQSFKSLVHSIDEAGGLIQYDFPVEESVPISNQSQVGSSARPTISLGRIRRQRQYQRRWGSRPTTSTEGDPLRFRRWVYAGSHRSRLVGSIGGKFKELSNHHVSVACTYPHIKLAPTVFRYPQNVEKLVPWIRRDLRAILGDDNVELIKDIVVAILQRYDIQSDMALNLLEDYLFDKAQLFVHELVNFAKSPYSIEAYDRVVQYSD